MATAGSGEPHGFRKIKVLLSDGMITAQPQRRHARERERERKLHEKITVFP